MTKTKLCKACGVTKLVSDFNRNAANRDGLQNRCRRCQVIANRKARLLHPETRREAHRRQMLDAETKAKKAARDAARRTAYPEKHNARNIVWRAVKRGDLTKPDACQRCGRSDFQIYAHHEDYSRPLTVTWLCAACHGQRHLELADVG